MWQMWLLFFIMGFFCPFTPLTAQKWKFQKNEQNAWRYHHLWQVYLNHDHMLHCSWDLTHDRCNCYFSFWAIFHPFTHNRSKMKNSRKWKKGLEISSFYTIVPKIMIKCYTVPEIHHKTDKTYFSFWAIFCPVTPLTARKIKISKNEKSLEISSFYMCPKNYD